MWMIKPLHLKMTKTALYKEFNVKYSLKKIQTNEQLIYNWNQTLVNVHG